MTDPLTFFNASLASLNTAINIGKLLKESTTSLKDAELKLKFAELIEALADAKISLSDARETMSELQNQVNLKKKIRFEDPFCFLEDDEKPLCSQCWESVGKVIHLPPPVRLDGITYYECSVCKKNITM